jgi:hypothetical protein
MGFYAGTPEISVTRKLPTLPHFYPERIYRVLTCKKLSAMSFGFAEKATKLFEVKAYSRDIGFKN